MKLFQKFMDNLAFLLRFAVDGPCSYHMIAKRVGTRVIIVVVCEPTQAVTNAYALQILKG